MQKATIILICIITGIFLVSLSAGFAITTFITSSYAFPENPGTYAYFNKIADMPHIYSQDRQSTEHFWKYGGDCDDRALAFQEYLKSKGATDVHIIYVHIIQNGTIMQDSTGSYGHAFILWNGKAYNPCFDTSRRFYNVDFAGYLQSLKDLYGYNTWYYEGQNVSEGTSF
jgi:hypothetical protein